MRKTILYFSLVLAVAISVASCINVVHDNVNVVSFSSKSFDNAPFVSKSLKSFAAIINNGPLNIEYHQSDKYGITILGDTGKVDCVRAEVVDGELRLRLEPGVYHDLWLKVLVQAPALSVIHQNGSGDISCDVLDRKPTVDLKTNGSGEIEISTIDCRDLHIVVNGSGAVRIGEVKSVTAGLKANGSGDIHLPAVKVEDELNAKINGSGSIKLNGTAQNVKATVTGSGSITGKVDYKHFENTKTGSGTIDL